jgi:hypothetical protein
MAEQKTVKILVFSQEQGWLPAFNFGLDDLKRQVALIRAAANGKRNKDDQAYLDAIADILSDIQAYGTGELTAQHFRALHGLGEYSRDPATDH